MIRSCLVHHHRLDAALVQFRQEVFSIWNGDPTRARARKILRPTTGCKHWHSTNWRLLPWLVPRDPYSDAIFAASSSCCRHHRSYTGDCPLSATHSKPSCSVALSAKCTAGASDYPILRWRKYQTQNPLIDGGTGSRPNLALPCISPHGWWRWPELILIRTLALRRTVLVPIFAPIVL